MATSKEMREDLQRDIDTSVMRRTAPNEYGLLWDVTMPLDEYDTRVQAIRDAEFQEQRESELSIDFFLYG